MPLIALLKTGDHVVYFAEQYQPTRALIGRVLRRFGVASTMLSIDDLDGKNVGVQQGTTGETYAGENAPGAQLVQYPSDGELWPAMQAGQIDAILQDQPVNYVHEQDDPDYKIVETYPTDESYGFAFAKGEKDELRDAVNKALKELQDDGGYQKIYDKYLAAK